MGDAVFRHLCLQCPAADGNKEFAFGDGDGKGCAAVDQGGKLFDKAAVEGVDRDLLGAKDALAGELLLKLFYIAVGIDGSAVGSPAAAMRA